MHRECGDDRTSIMKRARRAFRKSYSPIQAEINDLGEDLASLANAVAGTASDEAKATIKSLQQRFDVLADDVGSIADQGLEEARTTIAQNPITAVAVAFGLGIVVASLWRR